MTFDETRPTEDANGDPIVYEWRALVHVDSATQQSFYSAWAQDDGERERLDRWLVETFWPGDHGHISLRQDPLGSSISIGRERVVAVEIEVRRVMSEVEPF